MCFDLCGFDSGHVVVLGCVGVAVWVAVKMRFGSLDDGDRGGRESGESGEGRIEGRGRGVWHPCCFVGRLWSSVCMYGWVVYAMI